MRISIQSTRGSTLRGFAGAAAVALGLALLPHAAAAQVCGNGIVEGGTAACIGDCNGDGEVTVDEILIMVNLALTGGIEGCAAGDGNGDAQITVDEILTAVNNALTGCPTGGAQGAEECDDGGICIGGNKAGIACTSEADCGLDQDGVCVGGVDSFRGCSDDNDCDGGSCVRCKTFGGDGCAANCTLENSIALPLEPGRLASSGTITAGVCRGGDNAGQPCTADAQCLGLSNGFCLQGSTAAVFGPFISLPLDLSGSTAITAGKAGPDGVIPVAMRASDVNLPKIPVSTIACACVRGAVSSTCGGVTFYKDGSQAPNCSEGFASPATCPAEFPCAAVHGPGNTASGVVGCGASGITPNTVNFELDCVGSPGQPPEEPIITLADQGVPGSAFMILSAAIGTVVGACNGTAAAYGPDGEFCTDDDPVSSRGTPNTVPFVTGSATGWARNVADFPGDNVGPHTTFGAPFTCDGSGELTSASGVNLAGVFASCDQPTINDIVVPINFIAQ